VKGVKAFRKSSELNLATSGELNLATNKWQVLLLATNKWQVLLLATNKWLGANKFA
jgi:hypothetical protein